jgi:hypothetical protein
MIATEGLQSSPGADLQSWVYLIVYGSWFVVGLGVIVGSWRYWAHRRDGCPECRISGSAPTPRGGVSL